MIHDQRGLVLSGLALLMVLPAMLLAASYFRVVEMGGGVTSIQTIADKVNYTGHDAERMIDYLLVQGQPIDNTTLNALADNYCAATGLLVDIWRTDNTVIIHVRDPGLVVRYHASIELG
jgi:hypothetical protein